MSRQTLGWNAPAQAGWLRRLQQGPRGWARTPGFYTGPAIISWVALACVLGLGTASQGSRMMFLTVLVIVTAVAALILVGHAVWRYGQQRRETMLRFRMTITIGCDAIAALAILWQLIPILLVPLCA